MRGATFFVDDVLERRGLPRVRGHRRPWSRRPAAGSCLTYRTGGAARMMRDTGKHGREVGSTVTDPARSRAPEATRMTSAP